MAARSFTKKFNLDQNAVREFIMALTEESKTVKEKSFNSKFQHINDSKLILNVLGKNK